MLKLEDLEFEPDRYVKDGDHLSTNSIVIHTPGHKPEHACLYCTSDQGSMFTGDAIKPNSTGNLIDPWEPGTDLDTEENIHSLIKLTKYDFQRILPFHYYPLLIQASNKLQFLINKSPI